MSKTDKFWTTEETRQDKARRLMLVNEYANILTAYAIAMDKLLAAAMPTKHEKEAGA